MGQNSGAIIRAYSTGLVTGASATGGLVGGNTGGTIDSAYATGGVTSHGNAFATGGLVGLNENLGVLTNVYATGAVSGNALVGGLVGFNQGSIDNAYSAGRVTGANATGGLVGVNDAANGATVSDSFWDIQSSGQADLFDGRGTGKTSAEMRDADTFSAWDISAAGGSNAVWRIYEGYTGPLLRSFMTDLTVAVDDVNTTYNGANQTIGINYDAGVANRSLIFTDTASYRNAGSYSLGDYLYSGQQGYDINYTGGALEIARASLTVSGLIAADKVYDATVAATVSGGVLNGVMGGDTVNLTLQSGAFSDKNAGTDKVVTANASLDGADAGNYMLTNNTATTTASITRASLTITANDQIRVAGAPNPVLTLTYTGFVGGENASVLTTQPTASTTTGTTSPAGNYAITASGADSQNYVFTYAPGTLTVQGNAPSNNIASPGYVGALAYVDNLGRDEADDTRDEQDHLHANVSLLQIQDAGIRLPAGVQ